MKNYQRKYKTVINLCIHIPRKWVDCFQSQFPLESTIPVTHALGFRFCKLPQAVFSTNEFFQSDVLVRYWNDGKSSEIEVEFQQLAVYSHS